MKFFIENILNSKKGSKINRAHWKGDFWIETTRISQSIYFP